MTHTDHRYELIIHQLERLLQTLKEEPGTGVHRERPLVRPIRTWDEQTRHLRFAEKVKLHGYPGGLANTTRWRRDRRVAMYRERIASLTEREVVAREAVHEAMAYAVDAECFLGSLDSRDERGRFPVDDVDDLATHLIVWLDEAGYQVVPKPAGPASRET